MFLEEFMSRLTSSHTSMQDDHDFSEPVRIPITDEFDLHSIPPSQVKEILSEYFTECLLRNITVVQIIHGKGIGNLRRTVHALLDKSPCVSSYHLAHEQLGGWGATMVYLKPADHRG
jgi:DNA-nicking Smr family endonuclease